MNYKIALYFITLLYCNGGLAQNLVPNHSFENYTKLPVKILGEKIDSLAVMCHRSESEGLGRRLAKKLKEIIPRAQFAIPIHTWIRQLLH